MSRYRTSCHRIVSFLRRAKATAVPFFRTHTDRLTYFILRNITTALEETLTKELLATLDILHSSSGRLLSPAATNLTACNNNFFFRFVVNPLKPELNPICYLLALLGAHHFLHVGRIRVKSLTLRLLMSYICHIYIYIYIYGAPVLDVSRSHTTTHHSR